MSAVVFKAEAKNLEKVSSELRASLVRLRPHMGPASLQLLHQAIGSVAALRADIHAMNGSGDAS